MMISRMFLCLGLLLGSFSAGLIAQQEPDPKSSALEVFFDSKELKWRRLQAMRNLLEDQKGQLPAKFWKTFREDPTLQESIRNELPFWMKARPLDPDLNRYVGKASYSRSWELRLVAARAIAQSSRPYLLSCRDAAMSGETVEEVQREWLKSLVPRRPRLGNLRVAWRWRQSSENSKVIKELADEVLYHAALTRHPKAMIQRVWPGLGDGVKRGFAANPGSGPSRRILKNEVLLDLPLHHRAHRVLLAYRLRQKEPISAALKIGDHKLGSFELLPGRGNFDEQGGLRVLNLTPPTPSMKGESLSIRFEGEKVPELDLHGIVLLDEIFAGDSFESLHLPVTSRRVFDMMMCAPSLDLPKQSLLLFTGIHPPRTEGGGRLCNDEVTDLRFYLSKKAAESARNFHLTHWCKDPGGATFDVVLNGKAVVRVISQDLPRPARLKVKRRVLPLKLKTGWNEMVLTRVQGTSFVLDGIHLYP